MFSGRVQRVESREYLVIGFRECLVIGFRECLVIEFRECLVIGLREIESSLVIDLR